jgi:FtsZ-binding cell division protein ZapB
MNMGLAEDCENQGIKELEGKLILAKELFHEATEVIGQKNQEIKKLNFGLECAKKDFIDMTAAREALQRDYLKLKEQDNAAQDRIQELLHRLDEEKQHCDVLAHLLEAEKEKSAEAQAKLTAEAKKTEKELGDKVCELIVELGNQRRNNENALQRANKYYDEQKIAQGETRGVLKAMEVLVKNLTLFK